MSYLIGIIGCVGGFYYLKYSAKIRDFTGTVGFAEQYLGSGGTYTLHKLIGVLMIVLSIMYAFGGIQAILQATLGKFV